MDSKSGGKIVTKRYRQHNATPYDRVSATSSEPAPKDSNWFARVIFPATRVIASGASRILSSVFDSDNSDSDSDSDYSCSLSSSPESGGDASENDDNDENIYSLNEDHGVPQMNCDKSYDAEQVEQLLMKGKFTRQECDRFIEIIKFRTLDSDLRGEKDEHFGTGKSDKLCSKAVMEARKWLEQKKIELNPIPNMVDEVGSPVDVAKQYLKTRTPWTVSPTTMASPFQEGTSIAAAGHEFSSLFNKRSSLASGSWNIEDEIRSVRAKATEDMLKSSPSTRNVIPFYASSSSPIQTRETLNNSSISRRDEEEEDEGKELNSEKPTVLAIPAISMFEKHDPKTAGDLHSNDPKGSKTDDEYAILSAENVINGEERDENNIVTFFSEASVEVPVMEANSDKLVDEMMMVKAESKKPVGNSRRGGRGRGKERVG